MGRELGAEYPPPGEAEHTLALMELLRAKMAREYPSGVTRRDAHPKHHGCVRARFVVDALPSDLAVGLFAEPREYAALVRLSNQSGTPQADIKGDIRGAAIKLFDVAGPKLLPGAEDATTHDFIVITANKFVTRDVAQFRGLIAALVGGMLRLAWFMLTHPRVAWNLWRSLEKFASVLDATYTSPTPYSFGTRAVRYRLRPAAPGRAAIPSDPDDDYLRHELRERLAAAEARFDFLVQFQTDADAMPIEDPGVAWSEELSPFRKVATLVIPPQTFESDQQLALAENMSFNPWRCLAEHRPLGGINRARKVIYAGLSEFRHGRNGVAAAEPPAPE